MPIEKKYFGIGEVSRLLDVNASLIRYWESQFSEIKPRKNKNGVRQYTRTDIDSLRKIHHLIKVRGFTLLGAKEELAKDMGEQHHQMVIDKLRAIKSGLISLRSQL